MGPVSCRNGFRNKNMEGQGLEVRGAGWEGDLGGGLRVQRGQGHRRQAGWGCLLTGTVA